MDHVDQNALIKAFYHSTEEQLGKQLDLLVQSLGQRSFCQKAASHLVSLVRPEEAIPSSLARFKPLVRDGIELFLSRISYPRLRRAILDLSSHRDSRVTGERLLNLALHFPTLHKLGQIVARHPELDPKLKKWLILLEQGDYGTDPDSQAHHIRTQLEGLNSPFQIKLSPHIIAEASVATLHPFSWQNPGTSQINKGVFKVLKPEIEDNLQEELGILESVVSSLEQSRERYALQEMKLVNLFQEIRENLAREVNLTAEQENLAEASGIYNSVTGVRIPALAPFCTQTMTSMEYIDGVKVTDISLTKTQRQALARLAFEAIICMPLFATENLSLFHGDPHAGNILAVPGSTPESFEVALLDWTLAGHLSKKQRVIVMELLLGVIKNDSRTIARALGSLASGEENNIKIDRHYLAEKIKDLLSSKEYVACNHLKKAFWLLEKMTLEGLVFPSELILYRKSFFTLEGVLCDISPDFAMADAMESYLNSLMLQELPLRCVMWMTPAEDKSEYYRTLLSNRSLLELALYQNLSTWQQTMQLGSSLIEAQVKFTTDLFL